MDKNCVGDPFEDQKWNLLDKYLDDVAASTNSVDHRSSASSVELPEKLSAVDIERLESFYSSRYTKVHVAESPIKLYTHTPWLDENLAEIPLPESNPASWTKRGTGAICLFLHIDRELPPDVAKCTLALCRLTTCETFWRLQLGTDSTYTTPAMNSTSHLASALHNEDNPIFCLRFPDVSVATDFEQKVAETLRKMRENASRAPQERRKLVRRSLEEAKAMRRSVSKETISTPCMFKHLTRLSTDESSGHLLLDKPLDFVRN